MKKSPEGNDEDNDQDNDQDNDEDNETIFVVLDFESRTTKTIVVLDFFRGQRSSLEIVALDFS